MLRKKQLVKRIKLENCESTAKSVRYLSEIYYHECCSDSDKFALALCIAQYVYNRKTR